MVRTGWRCPECNRFYQGPSPPERCEWCGSSGALERIDHDAAPPPVAPGDEVRVEHRGDSIVGRVEGFDCGRILVRAGDGTGLRRVRSGDVVAVRDGASD